MASSSGPYGYGGGAGGKLRRPFARRLPSTPYDRPLSQQRSVGFGGGGGWVSKIINPAYRLISGGATRILPSLFSTTRSLQPLSPPPAPPLDDHDGGETIINQETRYDDQKISDNLGKSKSTGGVDPSEMKEKAEVQVPDLVEDRQQKAPEPSSVTELSDIEQLIKGNTFCREEIDRLMEILQSRVVDVEQGQIIASTSTSGKVDEAEIAPVRPRPENEEKLEDIIKGLTTSTRLIPPIVREEIGVSPVEIAKAYMSSRTSGVDFESKGIVLKDDGPSMHISDMASNRFLASPSPKPSIYWPGAVVQEQYSLLTPHSQRRRYGLISYPRTPYSRKTYLSTKSKLSPLEGQSRKLLNISSMPFSQTETPVYEQLRMTSAEDGHGSVGPICSVRCKFASKTSIKTSPSLWSTKNDFSHVKDSADRHFSLSTKNFEHELSSSSIFQSADQRDNPEADASGDRVHPQSSRLARQILEQISTPPMLKEKSDELKLVLGRRTSSDSDEASAIPNGLTTVTQVGELAQGKDKGSPFFKFPSQSTRANAVAGGTSSASEAPLQKTSTFFDSVDRRTWALENCHDTQMNNLLQANGDNSQKQGNYPVPGKSHNLPSAAGTQLPNTRRGPAPSGSKPILPPISVEKSSQRMKFAVGNNNSTSSGFTFPTAPPSSSLLEPPTPSIMPFSSAIESSTSLTFTFGDKKSGPALVFAFPSTTTDGPLPDDDPNFKFGSNHSRVSFALIGKDEVCC